MSNYSRVLVLSTVKFNLQAGGGVTMGNLFRGWPVDKIAQLYSEKITDADLSVCDNYFYLEPDHIRTLAGRMHHGLAEALRPMVAGSDEPMMSSVPFDVEALLAWCREFSPDIIYARPLDEPFYTTWLPLFLSRKLAIPFVTHVMDDWPAHFELKNGFLDWLIFKPLLHANLKRLFQHAAINMGISREMCEAFHDRYGSEFTPFHNCIDIDMWKRPEKSAEKKNEFVIVYLGAVTDTKELGSLQDIRDAVLSLKGKGYSVKFILYSAPMWKETITRHLEHGTDVVYGGFLRQHELPEKLSAADLLVLPINFGSASLAYIGYSLQTKVPEYMASGTPVLVYGPQSSPNVRYAKKYNWGIVVDIPDQILLEQTIKNIIDSPDSFEAYGKRAKSLAFINHDAKKIRSEFCSLLYDSAHSLTSGQVA
jgi:glycosyltransferase involved in cell wall biosynthesis